MSIYILILSVTFSLYLEGDVRVGKNLTHKVSHLNEDLPLIALAVTKLNKVGSDAEETHHLKVSWLTLANHIDELK
jgi:hypothetical protein